VLYKLRMGGTSQGASHAQDRAGHPGRSAHARRGLPGEMASRRAARAAAGHREATHGGHGHPDGGKGRSKAEHRHPKRGRKHKHRRRHKVKRPHSLAARAVTLPTAPATPPAPSNAPVATLGAPLSTAGAQRLLWRAGFGPRPGEAQALAGQPLQQVVYGLTRPSGEAMLNGPAPTNEEGKPLDPAHTWGDDHCWWLDRMVRSNQQLVERMTFIWHDWFANSNEQVDSSQLMLDQNQLFRDQALGSFYDLFVAVTANPAMLVFLDGIDNEKGDSNENYAREMMELFSLGADRGAYTEDDVREMGRALTGWQAEWSSEGGMHNFHYDPSKHDEGQKTVFGQTGNWDWEDAVRMCVSHPLHPSFFVTKLWGYFIPTQPDEATLASLQGLYTSSGFSIGAVVEAILQHPDFYEGPELVTPPVVYNAGLLRAIGRYIDTTAWAWLSSGAGQQLFYPPNVSGWEFSRWLDTSTVRARWELANYVVANTYPNPWPAEGEPQYDPTETAAQALQSALAYWGQPPLSSESEQCIAQFAQSCMPAEMAKWEQSPYRAIRQNALRMLIATSPDMQVS
jgi:hypothetical protein